MTIPRDTLDPNVYTTFDTTSGVSTLGDANQSMAIIAQKLAAGNGEAEKPIQVFGLGEVVEQAGAGSVAHLMARAAFAANRNIELYMVYQDDVAGTKATSTLTTTGTATKTGTINIYIGSDIVQATIIDGDDVTAVSTAIDSAIADNQDVLPVTSAFALGVVTLTAKNSGTNGNKIPIGVDFSDVTGINIVTVQMAGGATDPTLQEGLDALEGTDIRHIVTQFNDATNLGTLESSLRADAEPLSGVFRFGYAAESFVTVAAVSSLANGVDYQRVNIAYSRNTAEEQRGKYIDYEIAAGYAATYIKIDDPAQPRNGEIIGGMPTPAFNNYLNSIERQTLLENGVSALITEGNDVQILRSVTTKTTTNSVKDFNLLDQQKQDSLDFVASSVKAMFKINYRQVKGTPAVLSRMRSSVLAVLYDLEEQEIVVNVKANESGVIVKQAVGFAPGTVSVSIPAQIVDGVHVIDQNIILISL